MTTIASPQRRRRVYIGLAVTAVLLVGAMWERVVIAGLRRRCDAAVLEKYEEITTRPEREAEIQRQQLAAERLQCLERLDAESAERREQWTDIIQTCTQQLPELLAAADRPARIRVASSDEAADDSTDDRWWAFQPLRRPAVPSLPEWARTWANNEIDTFIAAELQRADLRPAPRLSPERLTRRLCFDLVGLPPGTWDTNGLDGLGHAQQVERLLASEGFGERWARVWLDLARYADSNGYEEDELRPDAYPYRDFVIWAMQVDLPFDQFLQWQVAGDLMYPEYPLAVAATGFLTGPPINTFLPQPEERLDELDDIVNTLSRSALGLTLGCARCHDHMYDPIPTEEYYRMVAVFKDTQRTHHFLTFDGGRQYREFHDPVVEVQQQLRDLCKATVIEENIAGLDYLTDEQKDILRQPLDPNNEEQAYLLSICDRCLLILNHQISLEFQPLPRDAERYQLLHARLSELQASLPPAPIRSLGITGSELSQTAVLERGQLKEAGHLVGPGFLTVATLDQPDWDTQTWRRWLPSNNAPSPNASPTAGAPRVALARWLTDLDTGAGHLAARVIVNRLWQHHMGRGLVDTPSDFGTQSDAPSHPDLLHWLACELVENNWQLKHIHRLIVNSATYQQSNQWTPKKQQVDPLNRLFARRPPQRLTAEMMRDAWLSSAGRLQLQHYGPAVFPPMPAAAIMQTQQDKAETWPTGPDDDRRSLWRRSVYVALRRTMPLPLLRLHDAPDASFSCERRPRTNSATQVLAMWNSQFAHDQAAATAERVQVAARQPRDVVFHAFQMTLNRSPDLAEQQRFGEFLQHRARQGVSSRLALTELCHVLLLSNEMYYID